MPGVGEVRPAGQNRPAEVFCLVLVEEFSTLLTNVTCKNEIFSKWFIKRVARRAKKILKRISDIIFFYPTLALFPYARILQMRYIRVP